MKKSCLLVIALACMPYLVSVPASAASYSITFYERTGPSAGNLFVDYIVSGTATFEINDVAVSPNNQVLFTDSDFLAFDAIMTTTLGGAQFTLGVDDFPPIGDGTLTNKREQGILFDALGQPLRFDTPSTTAGNGTSICDPSCTLTVLNRAALRLLDDNNFNRVFLSDGTITTVAVAVANGDAFTLFSGGWNFNPLGSISQTPSNSYYLIQAVVPPSLPDGDLNLDGKVDAGDIVIALRIAEGVITASPEQMLRGDVAPLIAGTPSPDGVINVADVLVIQQKVLGLISFP